MTYREANRRLNRALVLFLISGCISGVILGAAALRTAGGEDAHIFWISGAVGVAISLLAFRLAKRRVREHDAIKRAWKGNIESFSLFVFLVSGELRKEELSVLMYLWSFHGEKRATRDWNMYDVENAGAAYRDGLLMFWYVLIRMCGRGHLEFSPKHFHHLVIGDALWDTVKRRYPLSDFSVKRAEELAAAERAVQSIAS